MQNIYEKSTKLAIFLEIFQFCPSLPYSFICNLSFSFHNLFVQDRAKYKRS